MLSDLRATLHRDRTHVHQGIRPRTGKCRTGRPSCPVQGFLQRSGGAGSIRSEINFSVEARYQEQVWEIEVPLARPEFTSDDDVAALVESFHDTHDALFAVRDTGSDVEVLTWVAQVSLRPAGRGCPETAFRAGAEWRGRHTQSLFPGPGRHRHSGIPGTGPGNRTPLPRPAAGRVTGNDTGGRCQVGSGPQHQRIPADPPGGR